MFEPLLPIIRVPDRESCEGKARKNLASEAWSREHHHHNHCRPEPEPDGLSLYDDIYRTKITDQSQSGWFLAIPPLPPMTAGRPSPPFLPIPAFIPPPPHVPEPPFGGMPAPPIGG